MAAPIRLLQTGAEKLGAGDLAQRLDIRTGDEIEALAGSFNRMAGKPAGELRNAGGQGRGAHQAISKNCSRSKPRPPTC